MSQSRVLLRAARDAFDELETPSCGRRARQELRASGETLARHCIAFAGPASAEPVGGPGELDHGGRAAVRFALVEPYPVWIDGYPTRGEHLLIVPACRLVGSILCGYLDAPRVFYVVA